MASLQEQSQMSVAQLSAIPPLQAVPLGGEVHFVTSLTTLQALTLQVRSQG